MALWRLRSSAPPFVELAVPLAALWR